MVTARLYINGQHISDRGIFGDKLKIQKERASNEMYYRTKVSGSITFCKGDFDALYSMDYETECKIVLIDDNALLATAVFYKTDCEYDLDNNICVIKPNFVDSYEDLLTNYGQKNNITKLGIPVNTIGGSVRSILQLYLYGEGVVTNLIGNMSYDVDCTEPSDTAQVSQAGFYPIGDIITIEFTANNADLKYLDGVYMGKLMYRETGQGRGYNYATLKAKNGYTMSYRSGSGYNFECELLDRDGNNVLYKGLRVESNSMDYIPYGHIYHKGGYHCYATNTYEVEQSQVPVVEDLGSFGERTSRKVFARLLSNYQVGTGWRELTNDFVQNNYNYTWCKPTDNTYNRSNGLANADLWRRIVVSVETQDEPTEWGIDSQGRYFVQPTRANVQERYFPVFRSQWSPLSWWVLSDTSMAKRIENNSGTFECRDAYNILDVVRTLVQKADPNIMNVYSDFLSGLENHPICSEMNGASFYITPITNIKRTYYEQSAQRGDITLEEVFKLLKTMGLYWHLETARFTTLRIEHYMWFRNGGSYNEDIHNVIADLSQMKSPKLGNAWAHGLNKVSWDKSMIKRLEFSWQSECTEEFNGYPLDVKNAYVAKGSTETISAGNFVSDIDLVIASPNEVSDDAFAFFQANKAKQMDIITANVGATDVKASSYVNMQNGTLSFMWLEQNLLNYGLYGKNFAIQGVNFVCPFVKRFENQEITFPIGWNVLGNGLIRTPMGDGEIEKVEYDVTSGVARATIKLESFVPTEKYLRINPTSFNAPKQAINRRISVFASSSNWYTIGFCSWARITRDTDGTATLQVDENATNEERSQTFYFALDNLRVAFRVTQAFEDKHFNITPTTYRFSAEGGEAEFSIDAYDDWVVGNCPDWVRPRPESGDNDVKLTLIAEKNESTEEREGVVEVFVGRDSKVIGITQMAGEAPQDFISLTPSVYNASSQRGGVVVGVYASKDWDVIDIPSWASVVKRNAGEASVNFSANTSGSAREYTIMFACGNARAGFRLVQDVEDTHFEIKPTWHKYPSQGGVAEVAISAYDDWSIGAYPDWITPSPLTGNNNTILRLTASENPTATEKEGYVEIWVGDNKKVFAVSQSAGIGNFIELSQYNWVGVNKDGASVSITINSSGGWQIINKPDWITAKISQRDTNLVLLTASKNNDIEERTGEVTFACGDATAVLTISQNPQEEPSHLRIVRVNRDGCITCGNCYDFGDCPVGVFHIGDDGIPTIGEDCIACANCIGNISCPTEVFYWDYK